jgi:hypothetical protein
MLKRAKSFTIARINATKISASQQMTELHRCTNIRLHLSRSYTMPIRSHRLATALLTVLFAACSNDDPAAPKAKPSAPTAVSAAIGDASASIAFTPPASDGGDAIVNYTATCTDSGSNAVLGTGTISPVVVVGLTNGTEYACVIAARNGVGLGDPSPAVMVTPVAATE